MALSFAGLLFLNVKGDIPRYSRDKLLSFHPTPDTKSKGKRSLKRKAFEI